MSPTSKGSSPAPRLPQDFPCSLEELHESPIYRHMGIEVVEVRPDRARVRVAAQKALKNVQGVYHGGVIATAVDSAAALASMAAVGPQRTVSSIDLKLNFLTPVIEGDLVADARVLHLGRRTVVCDVDVLNGARLVAKALSTFAVLDISAIARVQAKQ